MYIVILSLLLRLFPFGTEPLDPVKEFRTQLPTQTDVKDKALVTKQKYERR